MNYLKLTLLLVVAGLGTGCGESSKSKLKGTVKVNGKLLPRGTLLAFPESGGETVIIPILDGKYEQELMPGHWKFALQYNEFRRAAIEQTEAEKKLAQRKVDPGPDKITLKPDERAAPANETPEQKAARLKAEQEQMELEQKRKKEAEAKAKAEKDRRDLLTLLPELPADFSDKDKSGLEKEVDSGETTYDIEINPRRKR